MLLPLDKYPTLDVHGETRDTIYTVLYDFIKDNLKLKNEIKKYYLHYWNQGATIVELRIE